MKHKPRQGFVYMYLIYLFSILLIHVLNLQSDVKLYLSLKPLRTVSSLLDINCMVRYRCEVDTGENSLPQYVPRLGEMILLPSNSSM